MKTVYKIKTDKKIPSEFDINEGDLIDFKSMLKITKFDFIIVGVAVVVALIAIQIIFAL